MFSNIVSDQSSKIPISFSHSFEVVTNLVRETNLVTNYNIHEC